MAKTNSILNSTLVKEGKHSVKVKLFSEDKSHEFLNIEFRDTDDVAIEVRLYAAYVPYFMASVKKQTDGAAGLTLSENLNYVKSNYIDIWTSYSDKGYLQASYFAPKA